MGGLRGCHGKGVLRERTVAVEEGGRPHLPRPSIHRRCGRWRSNRASARRCGSGACATPRRQAAPRRANAPPPCAARPWLPSRGPGARALRSRTFVHRRGRGGPAAPPRAAAPPHARLPSGAAARPTRRCRRRARRAQSILFSRAQGRGRAEPVGVCSGWVRRRRSGGGAPWFCTFWSSGCDDSASISSSMAPWRTALVRANPGSELCRSSLASVRHPTAWESAPGVESRSIASSSEPCPRSR